MKSTKTAFFIRHADALPADQDQADIDRELSEKGIHEAKEMAARLVDHSGFVKPEFFLVSSASRTRQTANIFSEFVGEPSTIFDKKLYHASAGYLLESLFQVDDQINTVSIFSHNPGISILCQMLKSQTITVPTAGIYKVDFNANSWLDANWENANIDFLIYP